MTAEKRTVKSVYRSEEVIKVGNLELVLDGSPYADEVQLMELPDRIVVGYLESDEDVGNPCTDIDGFGMIRSFSRKHINNIDPDEALEMMKNDPDIVPLSYYEHGLCLWDVTDGRVRSCPDQQWDVVRYAGIWIPDQCIRDSYMAQNGLSRKDWMVEQARSACATYTDWANGNCFGVVVEAFDLEGNRISHEAIGGFIGDDEADEGMEEHMAYAAEMELKHGET